MLSTARTGIAQIESSGQRRAVVGIGVGSMAAFTFTCEKLRMLQGVPDDSTDEIRRIGYGESASTAEIRHIQFKGNEIEFVYILPLLITA